MAVSKRKLGRSSVEVTILGLGGEGILRTYGYDREAYNLINKAIELGITYFESARAYSGSEDYYGNALGERRKDIFLASKSHARDKKGALRHLHETLTNMKTDHLDLWQVHDVRTEDDVEEIFGSQGAMEAFREAKEKGLVRLIGVTGHHDPAIVLKCIETFHFDTVLLPVNPAKPCDADIPSPPHTTGRNLCLLSPRAKDADLLRDDFTEVRIGKWFDCAEGYNRKMMV